MFETVFMIFLSLFQSELRLETCSDLALNTPRAPLSLPRYCHQHHDHHHHDHHHRHHHHHHHCHHQQLHNIPIFSGSWRRPTTFNSSSPSAILLLLFKCLSLAQVATHHNNISTHESRSGTGSDSESTRKVPTAHIPPIPIRDSAIRHKFPGLERRKFALPQRYETLNDSDDSQVIVPKENCKFIISGEGDLNSFDIKNINFLTNKFISKNNPIFLKDILKI